MLIFTFAKHNFAEMFIRDHPSSRVHCVREIVKNGGFSYVLNKRTFWPGLVNLSSCVFFSCSLCFWHTDSLMFLHMWGAPFSLRPPHVLSDLSWTDSPFSVLRTSPTLQNSAQRTAFPESALWPFLQCVLGCPRTCCASPLSPQNYIGTQLIWHVSYWLESNLIFLLAFS